MNNMPLVPFKLTHSRIIKGLSTSFDSLSKAVKATPLLTTNRKYSLLKQISELQDELKPRLQEQTLQEYTICFLGHLGTGKSSLINALLGVNDLMPTGDFGSGVTTVLWKISYANSYAAQIHFISQVEYDHILDDEFSRISDNDPEDYQPVPNTHKNCGKKYSEILKTLFGIKHGDKEACKSDAKILDILKSGFEEISATSPEDLVKALKDYQMPSQDFDFDDEEDPSPGEEKLQKWPLVKEITIKGPFAILEDGAVFIDVPGSGDQNVARSERAVEAINMSDHLCIVADIKRVANNKAALDLMSVRFQDELKMSGKYLSRTFVCTHSDIIRANKERLPEDEQRTWDRQENEINILDQKVKTFNSILKIFKENGSNRQRILDMEEEKKYYEGTRFGLLYHLEKTKKRGRRYLAIQRNKRVKKLIREAEEIWLPGGENIDPSLFQNLKVFTVSTSDYMGLQRITKDDTKTFNELADTEVEKLSTHLHGLSDIKSSDFSKNLIRQASHLISVMRRYAEENSAIQRAELRQQTKDQFQNQKKQLSESYSIITNNIIKQLNGLVKDTIDQNFSFGIDEAKSACVEMMRMHGRTPNNGGLHWKVYVATVRRGGHYKSIDFNKDLLDPITRAISTSWFEVFTRKAESIADKFLMESNQELEGFMENMENTILKIAPERERQLCQLHSDIREDNQYRQEITKKEIISTIKRKGEALKKEMMSTIQRQMGSIYQEAYQEWDGTRKYAYCKQYLENYLDQEKETIFKNVFWEYQKSLDEFSFKAMSPFDAQIKTLESSYACLWEERNTNYFTSVTAQIDNEHLKLKSNLASIERSLQSFNKPACGLVLFGQVR